VLQFDRIVTEYSATHLICIDLVLGSSERTALAPYFSETEPINETSQSDATQW